MCVCVSIGHGLVLHYKRHPYDDSVAVILSLQRLVCVCDCVCICVCVCL